MKRRDLRAHFLFSIRWRIDIRKNLISICLSKLPIQSFPFVVQWNSFNKSLLREHRLRQHYPKIAVARCLNQSQGRHLRSLNLFCKSHPPSRPTRRLCLLSLRIIRLAPHSVSTLALLQSFCLWWWSTSKGWKEKAKTHLKPGCGKGSAETCAVWNKAQRQRATATSELRLISHQLKREQSRQAAVVKSRETE